MRSKTPLTDRLREIQLSGGTQHLDFLARRLAAAVYAGTALGDIEAAAVFPLALDAAREANTTLCDTYKRLLDLGDLHYGPKGLTWQELTRDVSDSVTRGER